MAVQTNLFQSQGLGLEGGGIDDIGTGLGIGTLKDHQGFGILQNPLLGAAIFGHSRGAEIGTGGAVQNQGAVF